MFCVQSVPPDHLDIRATPVVQEESVGRTGNSFVPRDCFNVLCHHHPLMVPVTLCKVWATEHFAAKHSGVQQPRIFFIISKVGFTMCNPWCGSACIHSVAILERAAILCIIKDIITKASDPIFLAVKAGTHNPSIK